MPGGRAGIAPITIALKVDMDSATKKAAAAADETTRSVMMAYNKIGTLKIAAIGGVVGALSGIGAALLFGVGAASRFEDSFAGIKKTVDASEEEFDRLAMTIRDMALEIPIATSELNNIGELGGQLGIDAGGLPVFIDTIAKLGVATRLSTETASLSLARLKEIFQLPEAQIANLGSALVDLGNNFAALEDEILSTALRLAAGAKVAGATAADTLAIATALQAVGVQSQAGGTAMARVFQAITVATQTGGKALEQFTRVTGLTTAEFRDLSKEDPAQVLNLFLQGISRIAKEGGNYISILEDLNLKQQRSIRAILALAEADDLLEDTLRVSNNAFSLNNALTEEANKRFETLRSQNKLLKNSFQELKIEVGTAFLPVVKDVVQTFTTLLQTFRDNEGEMGKFGNLAGVLVGGLTVLGFGLSAVAGQFFTVRANADYLGLSVRQLKGEVLLLNQQIKAGTASFAMMNETISASTFRYITLGNAIKSSLGIIMNTFFLLSIAFTANAVANDKADKSAKQYIETISKSIPLTEKLRKEEEKLAQLRKTGGSQAAIDLSVKNVEYLNKELTALQNLQNQAFFNVAKFAPNFSLKEVEAANQAFININKGAEEITEDMRILQEAGRTPIFAPLEEDSELLLKAAQDASMTIEELRALMGGDINSLVAAISREIISGADPEEIKALGFALSDFYETAISSAEAGRQSSLFPAGAASEQTTAALNKIKADYSALQPILKRIRELDSESEFFIKHAEEMVTAYNQIAAETYGLQQISFTQFSVDEESAAKVYQVISGNIDEAVDKTEAFNEKLADMIGLITKASDEAYTMNNAFESIGTIELLDSSTIQENIDRAKNLKIFLDLAVTELIKQGYGGIAAQAMEAGLETENLSQLYAILTGQINELDLQDFNDGIIAANDEFANFQGNTEEFNKKLLESLQIQLGVTKGLVNEEARRAAVAEIRKNVEKNSEITTKSVLSVVKELVSMRREQLDTEEDIAEMQAKITAHNADIVYQEITITQAQKEQAIQAEALRNIKEAIATYGAENVVTDKEALELAQLALNIEKMREKISNVRSARERKSIRDKQREVKFLEMAVEQGVAEQLDLDAAREELADLTSPLSQAEKNILDLQLKIAEAEKVVLEERQKALSPEIISAIETYNRETQISSERAKELTQMEKDLARAVEDQNIQLIENTIKIAEIKEEFPGLADMATEIAGLIGVPATYLEAALQSYSDSYDGFVKITNAINNLTGGGGAGGEDLFTDPQTEVNLWPRGREGGTSFEKEQARIKTQPGFGPLYPAPYKAPTVQVDPAEAAKENLQFINKYGASGMYKVNPATPVTPTPYNPLSDLKSYLDLTQFDVGSLVPDIKKGIFKNIKESLQNSIMGNAYGGSVPVGRTSVVGEMGPELIMSTPGGTSVFSNKTGGGYGGITVENMNVNITGLPADPIAARKAAINIRRELTKLEKEGNAGTGLRNR